MLANIFGYQSFVGQKREGDVEESLADVCLGSESECQAPVVAVVVHLVPPVSGEEHHVPLLRSHVQVGDPAVVGQVVKGAEHRDAVPSERLNVRGVFRVNESPSLRVTDLKEPVTDGCLMETSVVLLPLVEEGVVKAAVHWDDIAHRTSPALQRVDKIGQ